MDDVREVKLPASLYRQIEALLPRLGFESVDAFVVHLVRQHVVSQEGEEIFTAEEEAEVKERLRALGYLD